MGWVTRSNEFPLGSVVQLRSGGAPLTITSTNQSTAEQTAVCVSQGGLAQTVVASPEAFMLYTGRLTASGKPDPYAFRNSR